MKILFCVFGILLTASTHAAEVVKSCSLGDHATQRVAVIRDSAIASTHIYYLLQGGKRTAVFGTPEQSRGSSVLVQCVGKKRRALIVSGEFTANALQGFVIAYPRVPGSPERLDFAEKTRPEWLYLGQDEMMVVVATLGRGETDARYVMYRHIVGQSDDQHVSAINELPSSAGLEMIRLKNFYR